MQHGAILFERQRPLFDRNIAERLNLLLQIIPKHLQLSCIEPQTGLDPVNMVLVRNLLRDLRDEGRTILLSTHMMGEAERMADEIVLIHRGRVVLDGSIVEVRSSFGRSTLHIEFEQGEGSFLAQLPQVRKASIESNSAELILADGTDPNDILMAAVGRLRIRKFELATPSLEEIFIDKVGRETLAEVAQ